MIVMRHLGFADTILMLRDGNKEMMGSPQEIISNLKTPYQAGFFGSGSVIDTCLFKGVKKGGMQTVLPHEVKNLKNTYHCLWYGFKTIL